MTSLPHLSPAPSRQVGLLTTRALLDTVAGDKRGAAGFWQPHTQSLALASVRLPHQESLQANTIRRLRTFMPRALSFPSLARQTWRKEKHSPLEARSSARAVRLQHWPAAVTTRAG